MIGKGVRAAGLFGCPCFKDTAQTPIKAKVAVARTAVRFVGQPLPNRVTSELPVIRLESGPDLVAKAVSAIAWRDCSVKQAEAPT